MDGQQIANMAYRQGGRAVHLLNRNKKAGRSGILLNGVRHPDREGEKMEIRRACFERNRNHANHKGNPQYLLHDCRRLDGFDDAEDVRR